MSGRDDLEGLKPVPGPDKTPRAKLTPFDQKLLGELEFGADMTLPTECNYVVDGWLDRGALSVVYGEANSGKSFWAVDLAHHVHEGLKWNGRLVQQGPVLYCAVEGGAQFAKRMIARKAKFMVLRRGMTLTGRSPYPSSLTRIMLHLEELHGPFALVVIDTLARVMGGADENAAPDISSLLFGADLIRRDTGAHVMFVHHSGKDVARGARGHSSLRAAVDTEIEITRDEDGTRHARVKKQRDAEGGAESAFTLKQVTLGQRADGMPVTSCVVNHHKEGTPPATAKLI